MVALPRSAYRAMGAQLDRVNDGSRKAAAVADVARFVQRVAPERFADPRDAEIARLTALVDQLQARLDALETPGGRTFARRPVITATEARDRTGLSLATVNRYLNSGFWAGEQDDSQRWLVYLDQELTPKPARKRKQKAR